MRKFITNKLIKPILFTILTIIILYGLREINIFSITFENLEYMTYDWRVRHFTSSLNVKNGKYRDDIILVGIDSSSFKEMKNNRNMRWPWNRRVYAELIDNLTKAGAKLIAFDIFFAEPSKFTKDPEQDEVLRKSVKKSGRVILAESADDPLIPELRRAPLDVAFIEHVRDTDAISRKSKVFPKHSVKAKYPLTITTAAYFRGQKPSDLIVKKESDGSKELIFPKVLGRVGNKFELIHNDIKIPVSKNGDFLINFFPDKYFLPEVSFYEVLLGKDLERFKNKIVLVGATARDLHDDFPTPISLYQQGGTMPGVKIHEHALATILENRFLRYSSKFFNFILLLSFIFPLSIIIFNVGAKLAVIVVVFFVMLVFLTSIILFYFSIVAPIVMPVAGIIFLFITIMAYRYVVEEREKQYIKSIFKQYVTQEVVDEILMDPEKHLKVGGSLIEITVMMADIRNFTSLSEKLGAEEVVELLNYFFEKMTDIVVKYGGTLDKYLGDGFMVIFGAPVRKEKFTLNAVLCAIEMQKEMKKIIDERLYNRKRPPEGLGIGITTGKAVVGNIGSEKYKEYTAIGGMVNLSARITSITPYECIYIDKKTKEYVKEYIKLSESFTSAFKGIKGDIELYSVLGEKISGGKLSGEKQK